MHLCGLLDLQYCVVFAERLDMYTSVVSSGKKNKAATSAYKQVPKLVNDVATPTAFQTLRQNSVSSNKPTRGPTSRAGQARTTLPVSPPEWRRWPGS